MTGEDKKSPQRFAMSSDSNSSIAARTAATAGQRFKQIGNRYRLLRPQETFREFLDPLRPWRRADRGSRAPDAAADRRLAGARVGQRAGHPDGETARQHPDPENADSQGLGGGTDA